MAPAEIAVRERLLAAAIGLIREHGPAGLTQPRVAKAAGISQSHLTYYFPTRAALLNAVLERAAMGQVAGIKAAFAAADKGLEPLAKALGAALEQPQNSRMLVSFVIAADQNPGTRAIFENLAVTMRAEIAAAAAKLGLPDDATTVALIHALGTGLAVLSLALGNTPLQPKTAETIAALFYLLDRQGEN